MSTKKPRVQVLLPAEVLQVYTEAAAIFGVSASKLSCEVLTQAADSIKQMAVIMAAAKANQSEAGVRAAEAFKDMLIDARQDAADAQVEFENVIAAGKVKSKAEVNTKA